MLFNLITGTRNFLFGNPHISATLLDELSHATDARVRARVAEHENTSLSTLFRLVQDENAEVRQSIAFNPKRTTTLLQQLAQDSSADVRYLIAEDALVPPAVLRLLSNDENPYVAQRALKTLSRLQRLDLVQQAA